MAGPSSFVPAPVSPSLPKQRFTLEQANRALPLVSRIVRDIVTTHQKIAEQQQKVARKSSTKSNKQSSMKPSTGSANEQPIDIQPLLERLQSYLDELLALGVELKDFDNGLVDFVGRHKGRDVYLCWKLNEPRVEYWHELDAGVAGRQQISSLDEAD